MSAHKERLDFALTVSQRAAELILGHYRSQTLGVESKADDSPVTIADKGAEQLIRDELASKYPEDGILAKNLTTSLLKTVIAGFLTRSMERSPLSMEFPCLEH